MARLAQLSEYHQKRLGDPSYCPTFETYPWVEGPPLHRRRIAIVSTAGLHRRDDPPFLFSLVTSGDSPPVESFYRVIPGNVAANELVTSHGSSFHDRTGFQKDWNVVFPLDRLRELASEGVIGSIADVHYSFLGGLQANQFERPARAVASLLKKDQVDGVVLTPV